MADMTVKTVDDVQKFVYEETIAAAGLRKINLETANTWINKDINVQITTPAAGALSFDAEDIVASMSMGDANEGYYEPEATISGTVSVATSGWITTGDKAVSEANVKIGKVAQSTLANGSTTISSGAEITPDVDDAQTINISAGYYPSNRTVVVAPMSDGTEAEVTSPDTEISSLTYTADDANHTFDISGSATINAPVVDTAGIISSTKGTKNAGTATVDATVAQVTVGATVSSNNVQVTPVIARTAKGGTDTWVDAASGAVTTTKPVSGAYVQVDAAAVSASATATGAVTVAGYGDTSHYQEAASTTITAGSAAAASAYVPITAGTVASGTAEIGSVSVDYDSTSGKFDVTGAANIPAPTASTAGFVGSGVGTLSGAANGATVDAEINKIAIAATITGTGTAKPVIATNNAGNVEAGTATTAAPSSGYYVAVQSAANQASVTASAAVTSAGYGTTTSGQYTDATTGSLTVGAEASDVTYIPLTGATLANSASAGEEYYDVSDSGPIIPSGGYLYINEGYTPNRKISLARLVPDQATITASTGAGYMLQGQSAYDKDGTLVVGTIPTYTGAYTVS